MAEALDFGMDGPTRLPRDSVGVPAALVQRFYDLSRINPLRDLKSLANFGCGWVRGSRGCRAGIEGRWASLPTRLPNARLAHDRLFDEFRIVFFRRTRSSDFGSRFPH